MPAPSDPSAIHLSNETQSVALRPHPFRAQGRVRHFLDRLHADDADDGLTGLVERERARCVPDKC